MADVIPVLDPTVSSASMPDYLYTAGSAGDSGLLHDEETDKILTCATLECTSYSHFLQFARQAQYVPVQKQLVSFMMYEL
jgi:hypothetical protein